MNVTSTSKNIATQKIFHILWSHYFVSVIGVNLELSNDNNEIVVIRPTSLQKKNSSLQIQTWDSNPNIRPEKKSLIFTDLRIPIIEKSLKINTWSS